MYCKFVECCVNTEKGKNIYHRNQNVLKINLNLHVVIIIMIASLIILSVYLICLKKMSQLSADCLNEIFEYLENDAVTLRSCLLVNRLWCKVSVRILWRRIRNYNTLIACLPNDSKDILFKNGVITSTSA